MRTVQLRRSMSLTFNAVASPNRQPEAAKNCTNTRHGLGGAATIAANSSGSRKHISAR
ncbi:hypothetical protein [Nocardia transvalensis]|uniref:hypothetical protein n=1 Tax=Nocardia transvalensis TaxID=37333 RepID=UPI001893696E|nr:hypothetical protein [Nocardia transvalensis]MBF6333248.1 hypothetical protein [Nocardia transvalensis]